MSWWGKSKPRRPDDRSIIWLRGRHRQLNSCRFAFANESTEAWRSWNFEEHLQFSLYSNEIEISFLFSFYFCLEREKKRRGRNFLRILRSRKVDGQWVSLLWPPCCSMLHIKDEEWDKESCVTNAIEYNDLSRKCLAASRNTKSSRSSKLWSSILIAENQFFWPKLTNYSKPPVRKKSSQQTWPPFCVFFLTI